MSGTPSKTPQEKKRLSYLKDRRNNYGENDKASRKAIPARKAGENRKLRRSAEQCLQLAQRSDEEKAAVIESSLRHDIQRVGGWTKDADIPLGDFIDFKARCRLLRASAATRSKVG